MASPAGAARSTTLASGLRVMVLPQPQLHGAHMALYARVGSRFESTATNGLSHFLEHMLYRGTPSHRSAHEVNDAFESIGGYLYAATQVDYGVFSVTLPPESLDEACGLFAEVLRSPTFSDIEIEKEIVCEEILEDLDDEGRQVDADNLSRTLIYPEHPLGFTITGTADQVRAFRREDLAAHHARHYTSANSVLVLAGAVDPDVALERCAQAFDAFPRGERIETPAPVHAQKRARLRVVDNASSQTELRVCLRAIPEFAPQRAEMDMLMRVVDDGMSTRLYHRICDAKGLCYDVSASYDGYEDDGVVDFAAGVQHARTTVVLREMFGLLEDLAQNGPTEEELAKARRRHRWEVDAMRDSPEDMAHYHGVEMLFGHTPSLDERIAQNARVTAKDIQRLVSEIATPDRLNVVAVGLLSRGEASKLGDLVRGWRGAAGP